MGGHSAAALEMRLTASGHVLSAVLKEGFQTIAQGIRTVKANREARPLQIIMRLVFDENWLMTRLGSFWAEHPAIALSLNPSMKSVDLVAEDMDLAMRFGKGVWPGLHAKKLVGAGYCIIGQPALMPISLKAVWRA